MKKAHSALVESLQASLLQGMVSIHCPRYLTQKPGLGLALSPGEATQKNLSAADDFLN